MRFARFSIQNFKSLLDFKINLRPCTVLIGLNGSGKSTVLQAMDFVCHLVSPDGLKPWLDARDWQLSDLYCKLDGGKHSSRNIDFVVLMEGKGDRYEWSGSFNRSKKFCTTESVKRQSDGKELLAVRDSHIVEDETKTPLTIGYQGSVLGAYKLGESGEHAILKDIVAFIRQTRSLELLSPVQMRKRVRGTAQDVGIGGERLSAYLHSLPSPRQMELRLALHDNYFPQLQSILTRAMKGGGKRLLVLEKFPEARSPLITDASHVNDGMLRLLAIMAETLFNKGCVLVDEIEDGFNPELMQSLVEYLTETSPAQAVVTTHSPLMLNFLSDETARESVQLVYKNARGETASVPFFSLAKTKLRLGVLGPGEVMVDVSLAEMSQLAAQPEEVANA